MFSLPCVAVLAAVLSGAGGSQAKPTGAPAPLPRPVGTAVLSGRVLDAVTKAPLARARVILTSPALSDPRVTITGADGVYRVENLPAGNYSIAVSRSGYAKAANGERRYSDPAPVALAEGQQLAGIDVALAPAGVIAGQILDEDKKPFAGAVVQALVSRMAGSQAALVPLASATTDDRGEFRLTGLPAGQYHVSAFDPAFDKVGDDTGALRYTPTYYPGVSVADDATHVIVTPGVEPKVKIVFALKIVKPARVSGTIATSDRRQLISGNIIMSPIHGQGLTSVPAEDVEILPDGSFSFRNVPPGRYQIRARGDVAPGAISLFATFRVVVEGRDIAHIDLVLLPGASLEGTLLVEAVRQPEPASLAGLRVRAPFADGSTFGDTPTGDVQTDGSYVIRGMMAGSHYIGVEGLQDPWVIKSVTHQGRDITDTGIHAQSRQQFRNVRVIITDVATDLSGMVRDAGGRPAAEATIVVVPLAEQFWTRTSRRFGLTRSGDDGRYRIRGLPAGEYRVVATTETDETEVYRRDLLRQLVDAGLPLSLEPLESRALDLALTSTSALQRTSSR
jgi:hypothetical protein